MFVWRSRHISSSFRHNFCVDPVIALFPVDRKLCLRHVIGLLKSGYQDGLVLVERSWIKVDGLSTGRPQKCWSGRSENVKVDGPWILKRGSGRFKSINVEGSLIFNHKNERFKSIKVDRPYGTLHSYFDDIRKLMFIKFCDIISHNLIIHNF